MLTVTDKKWITDNFATKKDFLDLKNEVSEKLDNMMEAIDHFMGKTNKVEDEQTVAFHKIYSEILPKIDNHETRIVRLEVSI